MKPDIVNVFIPRTVFGLGAIGQLATVINTFGVKKPLLVTDQGIVAAGIVRQVTEPLDAANISYGVYDNCGVEAPLSIINDLAAKVVSESYDLLIGVGGGSIMDSAKTASILATNPQLGLEQLLADEFPNQPLAKILIPTTSGTGSEWSYASVITTDTTDGLTKPFFSQRNFPDAVIIDPELTRKLPQGITAETGMDALAHAIESFTSNHANIVSDMFSSYAIELIATNLRKAFAKGEANIEARYNLAIASSLAMLAASTSGLGLAHFMNVALGKKAHISHGKTVALMLPHVMAFNLISNPSKFAKIAQLMGENIHKLNEMQAAQKSISAVRQLQADLHLPQSLGEVGIEKAHIDDLIDELFEFQAIPIKMDNPRDLSAADAINIYTAAFNSCAE